MGRKTMQSQKLALEGVVFYALNLVGDSWTLQAAQVGAQPVTQMSFATGSDEAGQRHMLRRVGISSKTLQGCGVSLEPGCFFTCERATIIFEQSTLDSTIISLKKINAYSQMGSPLAADCTAVMGDEKRPCVHNDWDDVRTRKGFKTLRCRICQGRWKVRNTTPRCLAFLHDNCTDPDCDGIHVRRKKSPQAGCESGCDTQTNAARSSIVSQVWDRCHSEVVSCASDLPSTEVSDECDAKADDDLCAGLRGLLSELPFEPTDSSASLCWTTTQTSLRPTPTSPESDLPVYVAPYPPMAHLLDPVYSRPPSCIVNCWLDNDSQTAGTKQP